MTTSVPDPASAPSLRWGIIAPGGIGRKFALDVSGQTSSTILAVGSRSQERADAFAARFRVPRAYGSYDALLADPDVDAVYISSPHSQHHDQAIAALRAGKPVLVEKAFTRSAAEAREVFAVAAEQGLFAMEAMWSRFLPHYRALADLVEAGELGTILEARAFHWQDLPADSVPRMWKPELAGGALLDLGVYPLSFLHMLFGVPDEITTVGTLTETGVDYLETVVLRYPNGTVATASAGMGAAGTNTASVTGTKARVDIGSTFYTPQNLTITAPDASARIVPGQIRGGGFEYEAAEAARCISEGRTQSDFMPWQATIEVLETMDEVRRSLGVVYPGE